MVCQIRWQFVLPIFLFIHKIKFTRACDVCVVQPLLTSGINCPVCSSHNGTYTGTHNDSIREWLQNIGTPNYTDAKNTNNWTTCNIEVLTCDNSPYRAIDGRCNNLKNPTWGMASTAFIRILPPKYRDGIHLVGDGVDGPLPLVRKLRTRVIQDGNAPDIVRLAAMQWGQLVAHDTLFGLATDPTIDCCNPSQPQQEELCLPVVIPKDDYFYSQYNVTCIAMPRNRFTHVGNDCVTGPAQQVNLNTHTLDGSAIYGSDTTTATSLRAFTGGKLRMQQSEDGRQFLPNRSPESIELFCSLVNTSEPCYDAGDPRVNQNTQISALTVVMFRVHNKIAQELQNEHSEWNDEMLYQETRKIVGAIMQHITYNEWLGLHIGKKMMAKHNLNPKTSGYTRYTDGINVGSLNSFTAAVFRTLHSTIQGLLGMYNSKFQNYNNVPLSNWFNRPLIVQQGDNYDGLLRGLMRQPMQIMDTKVTTQVTNLFLRNSLPYGQDLISFDILKGRDHGLQPYAQYLEVCTGYKARDFDDFGLTMSAEHVSLLRKSYASYKDVDLFVGGTLEAHVSGTRLGPTLLCIFTEEFYRKKWGDRFWYEVGGQPHSFNKEQLQEIRKISLSRLMCDGSDNITEVPLKSLLPLSHSNKIVKCSDIPQIDFSKF